MSEVNQEDVIHANPKELSSIFQVSSLEDAANKKIILAGSPAEKAEWMSYFKALHKKAEAEVSSVCSLSFSFSFWQKIAQNYVCLFPLKAL